MDNIYSLMIAVANKDIDLLNSLTTAAAYQAHTPTSDKRERLSMVHDIVDAVVNHRRAMVAPKSNYMSEETRSCLKRREKGIAQIYPYWDDGLCPADLAANADTFAADDEFDSRSDEDEENSAAHTVPASEPESEVLVLRDIIPEGFVVEDEEPLNFNFTHPSV